MRFEIVANLTKDLQSNMIPKWVEFEPGIKILEKSEDGRKVVIESHFSLIPNLRLKFGDVWRITQLR